MLLYEAKVPTLDRCSTIWKCIHASEHLSHQYHTPGLSNEVFDYVLAKRTKKLPLKFDSVDFLSKIDFTSFVWLITFELLELKQSYILHLKVLMCGIDAWGAQWRSCIFILCYTYLKLALLLHKTALSW